MPEDSTIKTVRGEDPQRHGWRYIGQNRYERGDQYLTDDGLAGWKLAFAVPGHEPFYVGRFSSLAALDEWRGNSDEAVEARRASAEERRRAHGPGAEAIGKVIVGESEVSDAIGYLRDMDPVERKRIVQRSKDWAELIAAYDTLLANAQS